MNRVEETVRQWIDEHQHELVQSLQQLVAVPSVNGSEGDCQRLVVEAFRQVCDVVDVWEPEVAWLERQPAYFPRGLSYRGRPNVVGVVKGSNRGSSLVVNAHIDVVDPGPAEAWAHGPWSGKVVDGRLHGRGAIDDKAGLAVMIHVARCLRVLGLQPAGDLILESVVDEEWGGGGTLATLERGYIADAALLFEPTDLALCPAARGGQAFKVTVTGKGAHPIRSYEGVSALEKAIPLIQALRELERDRQERFRTPLFAPYPVFLPIAIGAIEADQYPSKVPERCVFQGLMGYAPQESFQAARQELEACIAAVAAADPWLQNHPPRVEWPGLNKEGAETPADAPVVQLMAGAVADATGRPATITAFTAGCDLPYLRNDGGMPSVIFGPGDPAIAHTSQEQVMISDLVTAARVLALAVVRGF